MVERLVLYADDERSTVAEVREHFTRRKDRLRERRVYPQKASPGKPGGGADGEGEGRCAYVHVCAQATGACLRPWAGGGGIVPRRPKTLVHTHQLERAERSTVQTLCLPMAPCTVALRA